MVKGVRKKFGLPYNASPNKPAGELFKLQAFIDAHGAKALGAEFGGQDLPEWNKVEPYPAGVPTTPDAAAAGFIMETDFYKFRGRGAIQTTWRSNYSRLIQRIQGYTGPNPLIASYAQLWAGKNADLVATESSYAQWDELFSDADLRAIAVSNHSRGSGDYLIMDVDAAGLNGVTKGSIFYIGLRVSGGEGYAVTFRKRVIQILNSLGNTPDPFPGTIEL
jgi:hypothetical protein